MKLKKVLPLAILATIFFSGCIKDQNTTIVPAAGDAKLVYRDACAPTTWTLTAGQNINAGTVTVSNTGTDLTVTYNLTYPGACLGSVHLWIGRDLATLPRNKKGIIVPGHFPYVANATGLTSYSFTLPLDDFAAACDDIVYIVAHAEVDLDCDPLTINTQTAFGGDIPGGGPRWWYYGLYTVCCEDEETCTTQTGFGGNTAGSGNAWWYAFDTQGPACQNIYAGQQLMVGGSICYNAITGMITVTLGPGWSLTSSLESVKAQGYNTLPASRPPAGQFTLYKGTSLTFAGNGSRYYVIHLDVEYCE
jgi:hypothetical protein